MKSVAIAGGFDPLHEGHIDHIVKASKLGERLIVIIARDDQLEMKKGYCLLPLKVRAKVLKAVVAYYSKCPKFTIVTNIDPDTTCAETLKKVRPSIFAKGGDRTASNIPENELKVCEEIGCSVVFGVGDQLGSSSQYVKEAAEKISKPKTLPFPRIRCKRCSEEHIVRPGLTGPYYECGGKRVEVKDGKALIW